MRKISTAILFVLIFTLALQSADALTMTLSGPLDIQTDFSCNPSTQAMSEITTQIFNGYKYTPKNVGCLTWRSTSPYVIATGIVDKVNAYDCSANGKNGILISFEKSNYYPFRIEKYTCVELPNGKTITNKEEKMVPAQSTAKCPANKAIVGFKTMNSDYTGKFPRLKAILCANIDDSGQTTVNQCSDGIDNDNDGQIDYPADNGCTSSSDNDETTFACVNGKAKITLFSGSSTMVNGNPAVATYNGNPRWTANIPGATWIWHRFFVSNPLADTFATFTRTFSLPSDINGVAASITVAADNSYKCTLNSNQFANDPTELNYFDQNKDTYNLNGIVAGGQNTLSCEVKNWALARSDAYTNPAGLLYKLEVTGNSAVCNPVCGDGIISGNEQCDDGNTLNGDGCSSICTTTVQCSDTVNNDNDTNIDFPADMGCDNPNDPTEDPNPICGNNIIERGEQCDDGNVVSGDGCSALCRITPPVCGNNIINQGEQCDDGNRVNGDGCSISCQTEIPPTTTCGNAILERYEACDDGNLANGDGCSQFCDVTKQCSDGIDNDGDTRTDFPSDLGCTDPNDNTESPDPQSICGNSIIESGETCDDGNTLNGDGCSNTCQITFQCSDGVDNDGDTKIDFPNDPGCASTTDNSESPDPQSICGNGIIQTGEQCDDGNNINGDGCSSTCVITTQCNDQVDNDGDTKIDFPNDPGCSSSTDNTESPDPVCPIQQCPPNFTCNTNNQCVPNAVCGNGIIEQGETCDDGNTNNNDGCSSTCQIQNVPLPQCSDLIDNDGDGKIDFGQDPGCDSPTDNSESPDPVCPTQACPQPFVCNTNTNTCRLPQCRDGIDNDGDGRTDYPADIGCSSLNDDDETNAPGPTPKKTGSTKRHTQESNNNAFNDIIIEDFSLNKEAYNCNENIVASVVIRNNGNYDANNVFVKFTSNNLGVNEESEQMTLKEGKSQIMQQILSLPEDTENGDYMIAATLVKGIDLTTEASKISIVNCRQNEQYAPLQNTIDNYTPAYAEEESSSWDASTLTIMIVISVLILAIAYVAMLLL